MNAPSGAAPVPMMAIFDGAEGSPFESTAQTATRSVTLAGSDPPVVAGEIETRALQTAHFVVVFAISSPYNRVECVAARPPGREFTWPVRTGKNERPFGKHGVRGISIQSRV